MYRKPGLTCAAVVLAVGLLLPAAARAKAFQLHSNGPTAVAAFYSFSECLLSEVWFSVSEVRVREVPTHSELGVYLILFIFEYDTCTSEEDPVLISENYYFGPIPADAFSTQGNLRSASLQVTVDAYNGFAGELEPVTLDMTWTGEGKVIRRHSHGHQKYPGFQQIFHTYGTERSAIAAGSVLVKGRELLTDTRLQGAYLSVRKYGITTVVPSGPTD